MTIKLDVCGGSYPLGGDYLNVDLRDLPGVDVVADLSVGLPFIDGSITEIVSCGTLEHFTLNQIELILNEFYRVMDEGAKLVIGVPNLQAVMNAYLLGHMETDLANQYLYGGQQNPFDFHKIGFDYAMLRNLLEKAGFAACHQVPYHLPFHMPKYMLQVECMKRQPQSDREAPLDHDSTDSPSEALPFTGERMIPDDAERNDLYIKHQVRYRFASRYVRGLSVLDAGCGCGYGTHLLAMAAARNVTGIDISEVAVAYSKAHYKLNTTNFMAADCLAMPFVDGAFDCVVSFEVLEHLEAYAHYLDECKRVLTENGLFFVSTPNHKIWAETDNPFHFKEFDYNEFRALLESRFEVVDIFGQNIAPGYLVREENAARLSAFQSSMINYYDDSFAYTEKQMLALGSTTEALIHHLKQLTGEKLVYLHRAQMQTFHDVNSAIRQLARAMHEMPATVFFSVWDALIPSMVKRLFPKRVAQWIRRHLHNRLIAAGQMNSSLPPEFSAKPLQAPEQPERGISSFPGLQKIHFPVNSDRKRLIKPAVKPEPYGFADMVIRKEFVTEAHYFIAICRKV